MTREKEQFQLRILKAYSIVCDFDGEPRRKNVPSPKKRETFKQWKLRVLGENVKNVTLHGPWTPPQNMQISTIQEWSKKQPLESVLKVLAADKKKAIKETEEVKRSYVSFPRTTLDDLLREIADKEGLENAVQEFFCGFLNSVASDIDTEELLRDLIERFNGNARSLRKAKAGL